MNRLPDVLLVPISTFVSEPLSSRVALACYLVGRGSCLEEVRAASVLATALVADKISLKQNTYTPTAILTANKDEDSFEGNIHHCKQVYEPFIYYKVRLKRKPHASPQHA